jgi:hypothetical protein
MTAAEHKYAFNSGAIGASATDQSRFGFSNHRSSLLPLIADRNRRSSAASRSQGHRLSLRVQLAPRAKIDNCSGQSGNALHARGASRQHCNVNFASHVSITAFTKS